MKHLTISLGVFLTTLVFAMNAAVYADDVKVGLDTDDGSTKFKVQDSNSQDVAHIASDGSGYFKGKVGIGTTDTSAAELVVNGNIAAAPPTADDHVATKAYVDASSGGCAPTFVGYTATTYNGNMGYIKGMNAKCELEYPGSHACTFDEIIKLGASYPYTTNAWVIDGMTTHGPVDGGYNNSGFTSPNCYGWAYNQSSYYGAVATTWGSLQRKACNLSYAIPCCE